VRSRTTSLLRTVSRQMTTWAQQLDLEHSGDGALIDLDRLTIVADTPNGPAYMDAGGIGSGMNWGSATTSPSTSPSSAFHRAPASGPIVHRARPAPAKPSSRAGRDRIAARSQSAEPPIHLRTTNPIENQQAVTLTPHDPLIHRP
jgi:hypothetical protein